MTTEFRHRSLRGLVGEAKKAVLVGGKKRVSQKGLTHSLAAVKLTWEDPLADADSYYYWDRAADDWYQKVFVEKREENRPEFRPLQGQILFPYTYAARSRFHDSGWGYLLALVKATRLFRGSFAQALRSEDNFLEYLSGVGSFVHLQIVLAALRWIGRGNFRRFLADSRFLNSLLEGTRRDSLLRLAAEVKREPGSRRLVTPSFVYPPIDQGLDSTKAIPPYQFFQVLPAVAGEPLASVHFHRSLDADGGVQLDFHHDLSWLKIISRLVGRGVGRVTVMVGDFHVYVDEAEKAEHLSGHTGIKEALMAVTDGYAVGSAGAEKRLSRPGFYLRNARKVYCGLVK